MIVGDLNVMCIAILDDEANSPLVVHPYTVLPGAISFELLQTVAGRRRQVLESSRRIDHQQLSQHDVMQRGWQTGRTLTPEQSLGVTIAKALDHDNNGGR
jgi:hypothetical protein